MSSDKNMPLDYAIEVEGLHLVIECDKKDDMAAKFKALRYLTGMNRREFSDWLHIPYPTMYDWEAGNRKMPEYVFELIAYKVSREKALKIVDLTGQLIERQKLEKQGKEEGESA